MNPTSLKYKLQQGQNIYGTCITAHTPNWPQSVAACGLDFVFIDTEHIPINRAELSYMCRTYRALQLTSIVRVPSPDPYRASQVIDDGAVGVVAPYLEQVDEIRQLVGATKYRPLKGQKLQQYLQAPEQIPASLKQYLRNYNEENLCIANIESMPAIEQLDALLQVDGLDAVFIGPHDLSLSMGIPEQYDHPEFMAVVKTIINKARQHTLGVGIHFSLTPERQAEWVKEGINMIIHSADCTLFQQKLKQDIEHIKNTVGDQQSSKDTFSTTI